LSSNNNSNKTNSKLSLSLIGLNHEILKYILSSRDELLHMELYDWIVNHGHGAILLKVNYLFIEF